MDEQHRAVAMDFATRLRSVETAEQAIKAAESILRWLHPRAQLRGVSTAEIETLLKSAKEE